MEQHPLLKAVQESFGINPSLRTRRREVVDVRFAIMVAIKHKHKQMSLKKIGEMFSYPVIVKGKRKMKAMNHATVHHALKTHADKYNPDIDLRSFLYQNYCEAYDFCINLLDDKIYQPTTIAKIRNEFILEQMERKEVEQNFENYKVESAEKVKSLEQYIKKIDREYAKLLKEKEHISRAFKQLYNEKKARNEKMVQEAGA